MPPVKKPYRSPAAWAREIMAQVAAGKPPDLSETTLEVARRIDALRTMIKRDLDALEAPKHVYRWVAWAPEDGPTRLRTPAQERSELVQHLRRTFERGDEDGWFSEPELSAAQRVWLAEVEAARKRGGIMPAADQIPPERYMEAITASASRPQRRSAANQRALAKQIARKINQG